MTKKIKSFLISLLSFSLILSILIGYFSYQSIKTPVGEDKTEIVFEVEPGVTLSQIANQLEHQTLIRNAFLFLLYARFTQQSSKIKVGEYSLNKAMTPDDILAVLVSGKSITKNLTVAEGLNLYDIAEILERTGIGTKKEFFQLVHDKVFIKSLLAEDVPSLEGYLFPETYKFTKFESLKTMLTQMVKRFLVVWKDIEPIAKQMNWTRNQVVTFASIVEKETGAGFERPLVSSVFHNRLQKKMKLQTDPTVLYGKALATGGMVSNITKNDLLTATPYNTYAIYGLPPGPIANPGKEALLAAVKPSSSSYLYFVSKNNGTHVFSETLEQHNAAVKSFQMNSQARKGKSWRDLKKNSKKK